MATLKNKQGRTIELGKAAVDRIEFGGAVGVVRPTQYIVAAEDLPPDVGVEDNLWIEVHEEWGVDPQAHLVRGESPWLNQAGLTERESEWCL